MTDTITVPLSKLAPWSGNVRRTGVHDGIDELAASIAAHGLLQSLVVREGKRGKYQIIAGQRRYLALQALAKTGTIAKDYPVACIVATHTIDATELSLAENVVRAPMHPADQFEAFRSLIDDGASIADVAARFGVSEVTVTRRMKLGRLSPVILEAYRNGDIDLEEAQAFAITDDQEAQERVLQSLSSWNRQPHIIRRALTEHEVETSDKRVRFVGIDAYREAGGVIRQDLFSENDTGYIVDVALLDRLVAEKLKAVAAEIAAEGWHWVETVPEIAYGALSDFSHRFPDHADLPDDEQAELDALSQEYDSLVDSDDDNAERLAEIEARMDALTAKTEVWSADTLAVAGALVTLGYDGGVRIERGLVRKGDLPKASKTQPEAQDENVDDAETHSAGLSPRLVEELTAEKSAAIAAELMAEPDIALAAVVHALALDAFYRGHMSESCLKLSARSAHLSSAIAKPEGCKGLSAIEQERERIGDHLPGNPDDLWDWLLARSREELLDLLAVIAATSVDAVQRKTDRPDSSRLAHAQALARALQLDMGSWFKPTAENYFARVSRAQIIQAIDEAHGSHAPALEKLKKSELAARAEQLLAGTSWLPEPLRSATNDNTPANDATDALAAERAAAGCGYSAAGLFIVTSWRGAVASC